MRSAGAAAGSAWRAAGRTRSQPAASVSASTRAGSSICHTNAGLNEKGLVASASADGAIALTPGSSPYVTALPNIFVLDDELPVLGRCASRKNESVSEHEIKNSGAYWHITEIPNGIQQFRRRRQQR